MRAWDWGPGRGGQGEGGYGEGQTEEKLIAGSFSPFFNVR